MAKGDGRTADEDALGIQSQHPVPGKGLPRPDGGRGEGQPPDHHPRVPWRGDPRQRSHVVRGPAGAAELAGRPQGPDEGAAPRGDPAADGRGYRSSRRGPRGPMIEGFRLGAFSRGTTLWDGLDFAFGDGSAWLVAG